MEDACQSVVAGLASDVDGPLVVASVVVAAAEPFGGVACVGETVAGVAWHLAGGVQLLIGEVQLLAGVSVGAEILVAAFQLLACDAAVVAVVVAVVVALAVALRFAFDFVSVAELAVVAGLLVVLQLLADCKTAAGAAPLAPAVVHLMSSSIGFFID